MLRNISNTDSSSAISKPSPFNVGHWTYDARKKAIYVDSQGSDIILVEFGLTSPIKLKEFLAMLDASSVSPILRTFNEFKHGLTDYFEKEIHIRSKTELYHFRICGNSTDNDCWTGYFYNSSNEYNLKFELSAREIYHNSIVNSLSDGIVMMDAKFSVLFLNDAMCSILDYEKHFVAKSGLKYFVHPSSIETFEVFEELMSTNGTFHNFIQMVTKSGQIIEVEFEGKNISYQEMDYLFGRCRDVTLQNNAIKEMEIREKTNREIVESLPDTVMKIDESDIIRSFQSTDGSPFPVPTYQLIDQDFYTVFDISKTTVESSKQNGTVVEVIINRIERVWTYEFRTIQLPNDDMLVLARNITKQREYESNLKSAVEDAETANRAKSEFLANMSHEIRTPLNSIIGFSEAMEDLLPEEHRYLVKNVLTSSHSLLSLINDILDMSKIEAGSFDLQYESYSITQLCKEIELSFEKRASQKGIEIELIVDSSMPSLLKVDGHRLKQVLINLMGNAIKFTERGYVRLRAWYEESKQTLFVEVRDSGIGIPETEQDRIFGAFQQQSGQSSRKYGGTGLGLSISSKIVKKMDGKILLKSAVGKGSTFTISIPNLEPQLKIEEDESDKKYDQLVFEPSKILIVDDIESNRITLSLLLEKYNHKVNEISDPTKVLDYLKENTPDLIFMDIRMPEMSGDEVALLIKDKYPERSYPIIAYTASVLTEDLEHLHIIFDYIVTKPTTKSEILYVLKKFLPTIAQEEKDIEQSSNILEKDIVEELDQPDKEALLHYLANSVLKRYTEINEMGLLFEIEEFATLLSKWETPSGILVFHPITIDLLSYCKHFDTEKAEEQFETLLGTLNSIKENLIRTSEH